MVTEVLGKMESMPGSAGYDAGLRDMWDQAGALDSPEVMSAELTELLETASDSMQSLTQDDRDAVASAIDSLAFHARFDLTADQQGQIADTYIGMIGKLSDEEDWLGNPLFIAEIGQPLCQIMGKSKDPIRSMQQRGKLSQAWSNYKAEVTTDDTFDETRDLDPFIKNISEEFLPFSTEIDEETSAERDVPAYLSKAQIELLGWYGETLRGDTKTAKLAVWGACPDYREGLSERGVDIANFWNITDPDEQVEALERILQNPTASEIFKAEFEKFFGEDYDTVSDEQKRAVADDLDKLIQSTAASIQGRMPDFNGIRGRIMQQLSEARDLSKPGRKLKPVIKWVRQAFPEFESTDPDEIESFINDNVDPLKEFYGGKSQELEGAMDVILEASKPNVSNVRFMNRDMFDLKSGNLTADCTAWNLKTGFNAQTMPVWVTNPAFNFAYIYDGSAIVAKFGVILSFGSDGKPQVFIDSIETNKNLSGIQEMAATGRIDEGFAHLQDWADRNGFGTLKVCTFTNSTELTANLPIIKAESDNTFSFDGMQATQELLDGLSGTKIYEDDIYLQSYLGSEAAEEEHQEDLEEAEATTVEKWINDCLRYIGDSQSEYIWLDGDEEEGKEHKVKAITEEEFMGLIRSGYEDKILSALVAISDPFLYHRYEITADGLRQVRDESADISLSLGPNVRNPRILDKYLKLKPGNKSFAEAESEDAEDTRIKYEDLIEERRVRLIMNQIDHVGTSPISFTLEDVLDFYLDHVDLEKATKLLFGTTAATVSKEGAKGLILYLKSDYPVYNREPVEL